jgi:hypothetical protein
MDLSQFLIRTNIAQIVLPFILCVLLVPLERAFPRRGGSESVAPRWRANAVIAVAGVLVAFLTAHLMANTLASLGVSIRVISIASLPIPGAVKLISSLLIMDFLAYLVHVLAHKIGVLWRLHQVHHSDNHFDASTGLRIMGHGRRQILWFGVTAHPTAEWIANQLTQACSWEQIPRYLIGDRDGAYGEIFLRRARSIGIRDRPTSPRSPWQNAYAERLIGSIRRECVDHVVVFGERHLRHALLSYQNSYNATRTHLSLNKDAPGPRTIQTRGRIICRPILGSLHHQYARI